MLCKFPSPRSWASRSPYEQHRRHEHQRLGNHPPAGATTSAISATDSRSTFRTTFRRWATSATRRSSRTARSSARARNTNRGTATSARASTRPPKRLRFGDHGFLRLPGRHPLPELRRRRPNNPLISTDYDRRVLGSSLPHFNYGGSVDLAWRGIDFNLTFQGVGQRNSYLTDEMVQPLRGQWYNFATYIGGGIRGAVKTPSNRTSAPNTRVIRGPARTTTMRSPTTGSSTAPTSA